ncbi:hypothetical protein [Paracoccus aerius]|uniref:Transporter n=1 Tax=Paracoccus aerius TaxID=1915382 RepID=A0ABS1SAA2_9RHOB|nr:hypothetical protein [Paracoccus aerius]MBL3675663.1 hypothetical protein [Paracoccus aerius]GHG11409.1 hypothetical protein GCM10017322_03660 [Paracoccus aerius]
MAVWTKSAGLGAFAIGVALGQALPAAADGEFLQADVGRSTQSAVATVVRGPVSYGLNVSKYEDGRSGAANVTYALPIDAPATLRLGPSLGFQEDDDEDSEVTVGLRLVAERYVPADFGSAYLLGDFSTVNRSWFLLGQLTYAPADIGIELSRGGSETYHETTLAVQKRLTGSPVSLRIGYKISSDELFAGFSINTF